MSNKEVKGPSPVRQTRSWGAEPRASKLEMEGAEPRAERLVGAEPRATKLKGGGRAPSSKVDGGRGTKFVGRRGASRATTLEEGGPGPEQRIRRRRGSSPNKKVGGGGRAPHNKLGGGWAESREREKEGTERLAKRRRRERAGWKLRCREARGLSGYNPAGRSGRKKNFCLSQTKILT